MTLKAGLRARIGADPTIAGLVGDRIFPVVAEQGAAFPYIVYQQIGQGERTYSLQGASNMSRPRLQFSIWSSTYKNTQLIRNALMAVLDGYRGPLTDTDATLVSSIELADERETFETDEALYHTDLDFLVWFVG